MNKLLVILFLLFNINVIQEIYSNEIFPDIGRLKGVNIKTYATHVYNNLENLISAAITANPKILYN